MKTFLDNLPLAKEKMSGINTDQLAVAS